MGPKAHGSSSAAAEAAAVLLIQIFLITDTRISLRYKEGRYALLKRAIYFINANYGFMHYPYSATMGVFRNSACWHIAGVCNLLFVIPLHAARRAMAAAVGFSR